MSVKTVGQRRIATIPIYRARKVLINGRDATERVRGYYDGKKIVLTRYAIPEKTGRHELAHVVDKRLHGHISEKDARHIRRFGFEGFSLRRPHPPGCRCPFHAGRKRSAPREKGIGQAPGYRISRGGTGFVSGPIHGL